MFNVAVLSLSSQIAQEDPPGCCLSTIEGMLPPDEYKIVIKKEVPDDFETIADELMNLCVQDNPNIDLVLTLGGTGFGRHDVTPEATAAVCDRMTPGLAEAMRVSNLGVAPRAMLSRGVAGIRRDTLIVNLPGFCKAAGENFSAILPALDHGLEMLREDNMLIDNS